MISRAQRHRFCTWLIQSTLARGHELTDAELQMPALVFAPHPDDEAIACAGTILRKKQLGAPVRLVFMTDGSRSHEGFIQPERLSALRRSEASSAAALMGIEPNEVIFLDFDDSRLAAQEAAAVARVREIVRATQPAQVFAASARDRNPDHRATSRIVRAVLGECRARPQLYEYTVSMWGRWPWCGKIHTGPRPYRLLTQAMPGLIRCAAFWAQFRDVVTVHSVLDRKHAVLAAHRSQMSPLAPGAWTLPQLSDGEFLQWVFCGYEFFRARR